jgi:hypothetical protein
MLDDTFEQPLIEYETLYAQYFRVYCEWIGETSKTDPAAAGAQVLEMKHQVCAWHYITRTLPHPSFVCAGTASLLCAQSALSQSTAPNASGA